MTTERDQTVSERNLPEPEVAVAAAPAADPSLLGLPAFTVGSIALGLTQVGFLPTSSWSTRRRCSRSPMQPCSAR